MNILNILTTLLIIFYLTLPVILLQTYPPTVAFVIYNIIIIISVIIISWFDQISDGDDTLNINNREVYCSDLKNTKLCKVN